MEKASYIKFAWIFVGDGSKPFEEDKLFTRTWYATVPLSMDGCALPEHALRSIERDTLKEALIEMHGGEIVRRLRAGDYMDVEDAINDIIPDLDSYYCVGYVVNNYGDLAPEYLNESN